MQVQGELALLFARVCGRHVPGFGPTNDVILGKQRLQSPGSQRRRAQAGIHSGGPSPATLALSATCNLVVMGLVHLVALPAYPRSCYHAVLCLANLAQDVLRCAPMYVGCMDGGGGILAGLVGVLCIVCALWHVQDGPAICF